MCNFRVCRLVECDVLVVACLALNLCLTGSSFYKFPNYAYLEGLSFKILKNTVSAPRPSLSPSAPDYVSSLLFPNKSSSQPKVYQVKWSKWMLHSEKTQAKFPSESDQAKSPKQTEVSKRKPPC